MLVFFENKKLMRELKKSTQDYRGFTPPGNDYTNKSIPEQQNEFADQRHTEQLELMKQQHQQAMKQAELFHKSEIEQINKNHRIQVYLLATTIVISIVSLFLTK